jgi:hypothetical protein
MKKTLCALAAALLAFAPFAAAPPPAAQTRPAAPAARITALAVDMPGWLVAAVYGGGTALLYESLPEQKRMVEKLRWRVDGGAGHIAFAGANEIATAKDGTVRVFNQTTGAPLRTIAGINSYNTQRPLTPEEQRNRVTLPWSLKSSAVAAFIGNSGRVLTVSYSETQPNSGSGGVVTLIAPRPPRLSVEAADMAGNEGAALTLYSRDSTGIEWMSRDTTPHPSSAGTEAGYPPEERPPSNLSVPYFSPRSLFAAGADDKILVCTGSVMQLWNVSLASRDVLLNRNEAAVEVICAQNYGAETISASAIGGSGRESLFAFARGTTIDVCDSSTFAVIASIRTGAPVFALAFNAWGNVLAAATDAGITVYVFRKEASGYGYEIRGSIAFRN